jgi:hemoglobin
VIMETPLTLYDRLGDDNLKKLLDTFYDKVFESQVIGHMFKSTPKEVIKDKQFCFLSQFLGGPLRYNQKYGPPKMRMRHLPHPIDQAAKEEWLSIMKSSIDTLDIDSDFKETLYACFPNVAEFMVNR